jgi:subfamily B ATP-binding cassette protein MsbA
MQLPEGYDTRVGDNGVTLSGGQQQRLALARALLKDLAIFILDEATAMYDPEGEGELLQAIQALLQQRTVLLLTHHPAPLALADRIIRLEHGVAYEETVRQQSVGTVHVQR